MKLVHITYHFQYAEQIEAILDRHELCNYVRYSMVQGRDRDGKHFGSKIFPGSCDVVQALVPEAGVADLFADLQAFREERRSHDHLQALVLPVETVLDAPDTGGGGKVAD